MSIDLCGAVHFRPVRMVRDDGTGYVGFISTEPTQVNNDGQFKHIIAQLSVDRARGKIGLAIEAEGRLCFGGFGNAAGKVCGILRGVLYGHIVILTSTTVCDPGKVKHMRQPGCTGPPIANANCYERPDGWYCIYCVNTGVYPEIRCSIEQDINTYPCGAMEDPIGGALIPDGYGFRIHPTPGTYDLTGDDQPFWANQGQVGKVKYYLQDSVGMAVEPLFVHPDRPGFCDVCGAWLCNIIMCYANAYAAWVMQCTTVWPAAEETELGACCEFKDPEHTIFSACYTSDADLCEGIYKEWRGPGSRCEFVDCMSRHCEGIEVRAPCCLPDGRCIEVTEAACQAHGGLWMGGNVCRLTDGTVVEIPRDECLAAGGLWMGGQICGPCSNAHCPSDDVNLQARQFVLTFAEPIASVQFGAGWQSQPPNCFPLMDNQCFSGGPDTEACGGDPCWHHLIENDPKLGVLDSITTVCDMRLAETSQDAVNRYPHAEPHCVEISNAVLAEVGRQLRGLTNHDRLNSYQRRSINKWWERKWWDCATDAPAICEVEVRPYQTPCVFVADLVLTGIWADLWLSGHMGYSTLYPATPGNLGKVRVSAVFKLIAFLAIRLRDGWGEIDCPIHVTNAADSPCDPVLSDPERYMILASGGCTRVPLQVEWRGLQGPRPYSVGPFEYENRSMSAGMCNNVLCAIDGLIVPGEVNDLGDPDGRQRFEGDVVLLLDDNPAACEPRGEPPC